MPNGDLAGRKVTEAKFYLGYSGSVKDKEIVVYVAEPEPTDPQTRKLLFTWRNQSRQIRVLSPTHRDLTQVKLRASRPNPTKVPAICWCGLSDL
jgi:hypothetical protein